MRRLQAAGRTPGGTAWEIRATPAGGYVRVGRWAIAARPRGAGRGLALALAEVEL
ncbi:hypothetical protein I5G67_gp096 [Mycobacterium phage Aminay]|uniref:Uncharacterized protein n=1 Tax=Mycobacterium phage Aminay TaxID=2250291 RepID=A0A345KV80_9CAUD|nr:hypothetical protein I5G67_gp096 [Mycobacterium phage Aminay]AXH46932.1 hypothetical protein SEA_AMINAY_96 [Mycobacterium phage Aminay]